jgi:hypothetical protein
MGDKGALALAAGLKDNHALTHLDIRYTGIRNLPYVIYSFCSVLHSGNKTLWNMQLRTASAMSSQMGLSNDTE